MQGLRAVLGGSLIFVVLAPALVGAAAPAASEPAPASLTVSLTQDGLFGTSTAEHTYVGVRVAGPPPSQPTSLVNKSRTVSVPVKAILDTSKCYRPKPGIGDGGTTFWCLDIGSVPLATEVTGKLSGTRTALSLTVDARQGFLVWPFAVIILALIVAITLAAVPGFLDSLIQRAKLWNVVRNDDTITGLDSWVRIRLQRGADVKDLITVVGGLIANAPAQARQARQDLKTALETLPANRPLYAIANAEANETKLSVSDFFDDDGEPVVHPATRLTDLINLVNELSGQLDDLDARVKTFKAPYAVSIRREAEAARRAVNDVTTLVAAQAARHDLDVAWSVYVSVAADPDSRAGGLIKAAAGARQQATEAPQQTAAHLSTPQPLATAVPSTSLFKAALWTAGFAIAVIVIAVASVASTTYVGKPTFGSGADYLALALAAFGSTAAATIATVLAYWYITGD